MSLLQSLKPLHLRGVVFNFWTFGVSITLFKVSRKD